MQRIAKALATMAISLAAAYVPGAAAAQTFSPSAPHGLTQASRPRLPLAAAGCCVVTLQNNRTWTRGDVRIGGTFDGRQYFFATERELDIFVAAPESYAPVLRGDCIVTFAATGERVAGLLEYGLVHGGRTYFFSSESNLKEFEADARRFQSVDLAEGGRCPVSRVDDARIVQGMPQTVLVQHGLRFLFAGAHQRRLFLENPHRYDETNDDYEAGLSPAPKADDDAVAHLPPIAAQANAAPPGSRGKHDADGSLLGATPAMGGYCPVTIRQGGAWVRGRYDYRVEVGDWVFLTAGPGQREELAADPARFIPALGGDCPVSMVDRGERVRGSVFQAFEYQDRLYLFADADCKAAFKANPSKYELADVAAGGSCVVTKVDLGRETPGLASQAAWHKGMLYRFAGAEEKQKFLTEPERYAGQ